MFICGLQREISSRSDALRVKMVAEEEVLLLQEELDAVRQMLSSCQAECSRTKKLLSKKVEINVRTSLFTLNLNEGVNEGVNGPVIPEKHKKYFRKCVLT